MKGKALNAQKKEITTAFNADCGRKMILWLKYIGETSKSAEERAFEHFTACKKKEGAKSYLPYNTKYFR